MNEALFFSIITLNGFGLFLLIFKNTYSEFRYALSLPLGIIQILTISLFSFLFKYNVIIILIMLLIYFIKIIIQQGQKTIKRAVLLFAATFLISFIISKFGWVQLTYDSVAQIALGRSLFLIGLSTEISKLLASWGIFLPLIQGVSVFLNIDMFISFQALLIISMLLFYFLSLNKILNNGKLIITISIILLISTYFFIFQSAYIHNALLSSMCLFVAISSFLIAKKDENNLWIIVSFLFLLGYSFSRTESIIFSICLIMSILPIYYKTKSFNLFIKLSIIYSIVAIFWQCYLYTAIGFGSDIITPHRIIGILLVICLFVIYLLVTKLNNYDFIARNTDILLIFVLMFILAICSVLNTKHMFINFNIIIKNLLLKGTWSSFWWMTFVLFTIAFFVINKKEARCVGCFCISYFIIILILGFLRIPYRLGWSDSANRLFIGIAPICLIFIMMSIVEYKFYYNGIYKRDYSCPK